MGACLAKVVAGLKDKASIPARPSRTPSGQPGGPWGTLSMSELHKRPWLAAAHGSHRATRRDTTQRNYLRQHYYYCR